MERQPGWSLAELAEKLGGTLDGPADHRVLRPAPAEDDDPTGLAFAEGAYIERAMTSGVGAVIVPPDAPASGKPLLRHPKPRAAFGHFLAMSQRPLPIADGVSDQAWVSPLAKVDPTARVGAFAVVEAGATVGPNARIYPFAYVGESCVVGEGAVLFPHAVLVQEVTIGARSIVHPGAVLGADGFGFVWDGKRRVKVPQVGRVELGSDVEIGANSAVDRATAGATQIAEGVKLDNLVQIGHNTHIGAHTVMASQTGISGSTTVGERCVFAGQVGTADHLAIGDDVSLGGKAGVTKDIKASGQYLGYPAQPVMDEMRTQAALRKLPDLLKRIKELEKKVSDLESR
jgi:UDP-3-O-[3-hydroxymyristoyl] glucosamine N-acyltransferase